MVVLLPVFILISCTLNTIYQDRFLYLYSQSINVTHLLKKSVWLKVTVLWLRLSEIKVSKSVLCGWALLFYGFCGTKQTQIQKACFQPPERLIHNDFELFLSGFPPVSCYWLIARDQGATWGKQNFHCWFIYPLHHLSTLSSCLRNLKCAKTPTLSPQGQYDCDLKSNHKKENSLARIVNEIGYLQLSDHLSLSSGWYNSNKLKFKSQDLNGLFYL